MFGDTPHISQFTPSDANGSRDRVASASCSGRAISCEKSYQSVGIGVSNSGTASENGTIGLIARARTTADATMPAASIGTKIGRASCRERQEVWEGAGAVT